MNSVKKKIAAVASGVAAVALVGVGTAYARWSSAAIGSGGSKSLAVTTVTVSATTPTADLYPGSNAGRVYFTLSNSNPYAVMFTSMTSGIVTSNDPTFCPASTVTVRNASGLSITAAANSSNVAESIANVVSMASGAPDACQGVSFMIGLTLSGTQS